MEINKIYQGDALWILQKMPNESIDCCITSPPYWGLRDYQTESIVWGGDKHCRHEWGEAKKTLRHKSGETNPRKESWYKDKGASTDKGNQFCISCGGWRGSLGLEPTFDLYISHLLQIFNEVKRVLKKTGTCWVNLGDSYSGSGGDHKEWHKNDAGFQGGLMRGCRPTAKTNIPAKSLCCIPDRFKIAMVDAGWTCRNEIIWWKRNCMPASVKDRFTVDFEKVFFFVKNKEYWFKQQFEESVDPESFTGRRPRRRPKLANYDIEHCPVAGKIKPDGWLNDVGKTYPQRNKRCVWDIPTTPFSGAHFAVFPKALVEPMIKSGCPEDGIVLDPFLGSGTVAVVAKKLYRNYIGIELNQEYIKMAEKRIAQTWVNMELV